jgi:xanthine/CO dehydrogenase XdhC/CoxF family maturation factor
VSELSEILDRIDELAAAGEPMALATIVATRGSTYRQAGARMLVPASGDPIGNISGGCLEDDVARIGHEVISSGRPRTVEFDMTADDDAVWGYGLGCNGSIELFVEPTDGAAETAAAIRAAVAATGSVIATAISGPRIGSRWTASAEEADATIREGRPSVIERDDERIFLEAIVPPIHLVVCSAGHDAIPLVRQAAELGWRVTVADVRRALLTRERFPAASDFCDADPEQAAAALGADTRTAVLVMSHNYLRDIGYLRSFLAAARPLAYLGVLGPRGRTEQMLDEISQSDAMARLHAPAGLDIGAEGPEEVALAIVAEILAVTRGRVGAPLRDRRGRIHADREG